MTHPQSPLLALIALSEKADGGTWDFQEEMTEFYNDADGNSCGGHPTGNYYIWDKDGPNEDDAWIHPHHKENVEFICALVNWFRSNASDLRAANARGDDGKVRLWRNAYVGALTSKFAAEQYIGYEEARILAEEAANDLETDFEQATETLNQKRATPGYEVQS